MIKAELLSPAGTLATLKAVEAAGADAVYAAGELFGARAYANNFTGEELLEAIDYLHLRGKSLYLTVNTLLKEPELYGQLYFMIEPLYRQGLDAVIVQDIGVLSFLKREFPLMDFHASTQMSVTSPYGARFLKDLGCNRIVLARELSLEEIKDIHKQVKIEIESFVHGALCYSYSGLCLFSSMLGGRSGNRGRCAQPCRLPYSVGDGKVAHLLSLKDLNTIEFLPQILKSGVLSLKIEGRMKQTAYAAGVTAIYRNYLDRYLENPGGEFKVEGKDSKHLFDLGNRSGFTKGYYHLEGKSMGEMLTLKKPAHTRNISEEGEQTFLDTKIKINAEVLLSKEKPARLTLSVISNGIMQDDHQEVSVLGDIVQKAQKQALQGSDLEKRLKKTGNTDFEIDEIKIQLEEDIFLTVGAVNQLRRDGIQALTEALLKKYRREDGIGTNQRLSEEWQIPAVQKKDTGNPYLAVSIEEASQLSPLLARESIEYIYVDSNTFTKEMAQVIHKAGKKVYLALPFAFRRESAEWFEDNWDEILDAKPDGFIAKTYDELGFLREKKDVSILTDSSIYCWNREAWETIRDSGKGEDNIHFTLPLELNERELKNRAFPGGEMVLYGYLPLMVSAQCLKSNTNGCDKGSRKEREIFYLKDRYGKQFPVRSSCSGCDNVIYNSTPLSLLHLPKDVKRVGAEGYRLSFTLENNKQLEQILDFYEDAFLNKEKLHEDSYLQEYTKGHFHRGVE